jgi:hypothetical protein
MSAKVVSCSNINGYLRNYQDCLTSTYKRYILPILSYASPIWSPSYKTKIQELERAQKRFVRPLFGIGNYTNNLAKIGLKSLEEQRKIYDLVLVHKIYHQKLRVAVIVPQ